MTDGLDGVIAAETVLSHSESRPPQLWVRDRTLAQAVALGYEATVALLWEGFVGEGLTRESVTRDLGAARERMFARLGGWLDRAAQLPPLQAGRACLADVSDDAAPAEIASALAVAVPALLRAQRGERPIPPDPSLTVAADVLRMLTGAPQPKAAQALDTYIAVAMENGLGTSSFAARVVASTRASLSSAILGAYCAFMGPLHGGAPGPVLDVLDEAAASGDVDRWLDDKLVRGERLVGFGNRAFPHGDPRADLLAAALRTLSPDTPRARFAADFERRALAALERHRPGKGLRPNLELNAALLLDACGFPREAFTPVFALGRAPGWIAHALEQQRTGRMIRPASRYIGPALG